MQRKERKKILESRILEKRNGTVEDLGGRISWSGASLLCFTVSKSGSRAGSPARRGILRQRESQDSFRLDRVRRAGNIVKCAGAESSHVSVPVSQVRKHDHGSASGRRRQNAHGSAKIAIRQIVAAQHKLKRLLLDATARGRQGSAMDGLHPDAPDDFLNFLAL
jgi:hypothetical protein